MGATILWVSAPNCKSYAHQCNQRIMLVWSPDIFEVWTVKQNEQTEDINSGSGHCDDLQNQMKKI